MASPVDAVRTYRGDDPDGPRVSWVPVSGFEGGGGVGVRVISLIV
jgi:hypothetical protein